MKFYTAIYSHKDYIYHHYIEDGKRKHHKIKFKPEIGIPVRESTNYRNIHNEFIKLIECDSMYEYNNKKYERRKSGLTGFHNDIDPIYQFIYQEYKEKIEYDFSLIKILNIDIEIFAPNGWAEWILNQKAIYPINLITVQHYHENQFITYGLFDFDLKKSERKNVVYKQFSSEEELLKEFVKDWNEYDPDVLTGWNIDFFDINYIVRRIQEVHGELISEIELRKLTRSGLLPIAANGKFKLPGRSILDLIDLYKKFVLTPRESYSLDFISSAELGQEKIKYNEVDNLAELSLKDPQKFVDYNIMDVDLCYQIDQKLHLINLAVDVAFSMFCVFENSIGTITKWDTLIYHELRKNNIIVPARNSNVKQKYPGGFVQAPEPGFKNWITVYDIASSYPNQQRTLNISPETIVEYNDVPAELKPIVDQLGYLLEDDKFVLNPKFLDIEYLENEVQPLLQKHNLILAGNGQLFRKDKFGFIPALVERIFLERVELKSKIKEYEKIVNRIDELIETK